jgi:hypothetical protein
MVLLTLCSSPKVLPVTERDDDPFEAVSDDPRVLTSNLKQTDFFFL